MLSATCIWLRFEISNTVQGDFPNGLALCFSNTAVFASGTWVLRSPANFYCTATWGHTNDEVKALVHTWFRRTCALCAAGVLAYYSIVFGIDIYNTVSGRSTCMHSRCAQSYAGMHGMNSCVRAWCVLGTGAAHRERMSALVVLDTIVTAVLFALYPVLQVVLPRQRSATRHTAVDDWPFSLLSSLLQIIFSSYFCLECYLRMKRICNLETSLAHSVSCPQAAIASSVRARTQARARARTHTQTRARARTGCGAEPAASRGPGAQGGRSLRVDQRERECNGS
jgi:hypothetical protein